MEENQSILIKEKTITLGSTIIQTSNISSIALTKLDSKYYLKRLENKNAILHFPGVKTAILIYITSTSIVLVLAVFGYLDTLEVENWEDVFAVSTIAFSALYALLIGFWILVSLGNLNDLNKEEIALVIETNAGSKSVIISKDKTVLNKIFLSIQDYIENPSESPIYFDFSQDRSIRIEGGVGGSINSGDISW